MTYSSIITPTLPNKEYAVPYASAQSSTDYRYVGIATDAYFKHTLSGFCRNFEPDKSHLVISEDQMDTVASFLGLAKDKQTFMILVSEYLGIPISAFDC